MYRSSDDIHDVLDKIKTRVQVEMNALPTAIVCYNDQLAIEVIGMLSKEGIQVPDQISVAGFDDYQISQYIDPTLTTMDHPKRKMGHTAAQLLLDMLDGKDGSSKILDSDLIVRASTKSI